MGDLLARLRGAVGDAAVVTDPDVLAPHLRDWTGRFQGSARALVRPATTEEVAAVVAACRATGTPLVTQGGNTGLVGGATPVAGGVVLTTGRLRRGPTVDPAAGTVVAGAGVTLGDVQRAARAEGWRYPLDLTARDTATVGGTVATNAGGTHVVAHGMTRRRLLGVEAVLGTGAVVSDLSGLEKDNTGFDLAALLCGSEGTLGVVTAACLRLAPVPAATATALVGADDLAEAVTLVSRARRALPDLEAAEVVLADGVELVTATTGLAPPLRPLPPVTLLLEVAGAQGAEDRLARFLAEVAPAAPSALAVDERGRADLWRVREEHAAAVNTVGPPHKFDVTLPPGALVATVAHVRATVAGLVPGAHTWVFGHLGDGNLHLNVTGVDPHDERVDAAVLTAVAAAGGSISAEHGIGRAKASYLGLARTEAEQATFRALKAALDPDAVLNPGVLLP